MPKLTIFDKLLQRTLLPLIPKSITPNQVTVMRFIITPFIVWLLFVQQYTFGLALFLFAALTDALDGAMARTRNQITDAGKMIDPIADKFLIFSVALVLIMNHIGWHIVLVLFVVEGLVMLRGLMWYTKGTVLQANIWGKVKMILEVTAVVFIFLGILFHAPLFFSIAFGVLVVAIAFASVSFFSYGI